MEKQIYFPYSQQKLYTCMQALRNIAVLYIQLAYVTKALQIEKVINFPGLSIKNSRPFFH